jgi:cytochrome c biogenesis protein CcdA
VPQSAYDPYAATGGSAAQGGYPAYDAPGQWQAPPAAYGAPPAQNTSALVLTILSGIITVSCCVPGVVPLILGIMALSKNSTDPEASRRLTKWGRIAFAAGIAFVVIAVGVLITFGLAGVFDDGGFSSEPDYTY